MSKEREDIKRLEDELKQKKASLLRAEQSCQHDWTSVVADHIYREGYTIPGDAPGTMGIDWRGPCYVPSSTEERWKRTCTKCGKVEHTTRTQEKVTHTPTFV
jgi:hypothetical protein